MFQFFVNALGLQHLFVCSFRLLLSCIKKERKDKIVLFTLTEMQTQSYYNWIKIIIGKI